MKQNIIAELTLYRYRYIIGYTLFFIFLISLLIIAGFFIPGGLTKAEQTSTVASMNIAFRPPFNFPIIDLPYHLLQKTSVSFLGLNETAIKLPSLILGFISGVALLFLLRVWFRPNIAILSGVIAITASQFLIISQAGTPTITLFFWSIILLLAATYLSRSKKLSLLWKIVFSVTAALSLYTPLSIYILGAMFFSALLHPHLRSTVKKMSKLRILFALIAGAILLTPLGIHLVREPSTGLTLLGVNNIDWSVSTLWANVQLLAQSLFGFAHPTIGPETITPLFGIPVAALMLLGFMRILADHHSTRTYALIVWLIPVTFILLFQPSLTAIAFVPLILLLAVGVETLIREWYGLFPRNPYARIAALIPLAILIGGIVFSGIARYENSFRYNSDVARYFSHDLHLVRNHLKDDGKDTALVVPKSQKEFYAFLNREYPKLTVSTKLTGNNDRVIIPPKLAKQNRLQFDQPSKIVTDYYTANSLRFYIYKSNGGQ